MYEENAKRMHASSATKPRLDTVWKMSFEQLEASPSALLGVLSFLMPDAVPQSLFEGPVAGGFPKSLMFYEDVMSFSEVMESLLSASLIRRNPETQDISLHRLVQQQFRYHMKPEDHQRAFEDAARLLNVAFPPKPRLSGQMYNVWDKCRKYLQHILSLAENYMKESIGPYGLHPTYDFLQLSTHCARYLLETGSYVELANLLEVVYGAYNSWEGRHENPMLLTKVLLPTSTMWLHRGDFELSERYLKDILEITKKYAPDDKDALVSPYNNIGNATASANRPKEAIEWYERLAEIEGVDDNLAPDALTQLNLGRAFWYDGRNSDALERYAVALKGFENSENWAMLAFTYYAYGNFHRKNEWFKDARTWFTKARKTWTENDNAPTHVFAGACTYKLGCVALDLGEVEEAISILQQALTIAQVHKTQLSGEYARTLWKLSIALRSNSELGKDIEPRMNDAWILLNEAGVDSGALLANEATYDSLICCLWR